LLFDWFTSVQLFYESTCILPDIAWIVTSRMVVKGLLLLK